MNTTDKPNENSPNQETFLDISRMADDQMVGNPILQVTLTLLKYGREENLEFILRSMFEWLSEEFSPQQARNLLDTILHCFRQAITIRRLS